MIYIDNSYKDTTYETPNTLVDPKLKEEKEYNLAWAKAIYSMHIRGKSGIPVDEAYRWEQQRLYGKGLQDTRIYKQIVNTEDISTDDALETDGVTRNTLESRRKGWKNINEEIVSIAPKIKDVFHGLFDNTDFEIAADTIDLNSGALKDRMKYGLLTQTLFKKELDRLRAVGNIPEPQREFVPQNVSELEMYEAAGGFKLQVAKTMEKLIKHSFLISDWDFTLKTKLLDDVLDIGYIALREVYDADTCKAKAKYVDPACLSIQYSKEDDYEDPDWAGYYTTYTISQLEQKGYLREELQQLALEFSSKLGNPSRDVFKDYSRKNTLGGYDYDFYRIPVYEVEWVDSNMYRYLRYKNKYGKDRYRPIPYDDDTEYKNKEVLNNNTRIIYSAKWIIGSDKIFDYGKASDQLRPRPSKPVLSFRVVKVTDNPIFKRLIPVLDKMQLAWLRYQNALIMSAAGGWAVNVRLLNNITLGGKKLSFAQVFRMFRDKHILFYSDTPVHGRYEGGAVNPVTPLPSMLMDEIKAAIDDFEYSMRMVESVTGLTPVALGGTPEERAGKGTTELSYAATQNVMRPIISNIMVLKSRIAESMMLHIQMLSKTNEKSYEAYADVVGEMDMVGIKSATYEGTRYGISLRPRPTDQEKAEIKELIVEAISLGRDGVKSLELDDALQMFEAMANNTNLTEMRLMLSYKIRKYREQAQQAAMQTQKFQADAAMQQQQQKLQAEAQGKQFDAQIDSQKLQQEHTSKIAQLNLQGNIDVKRDVMKYAHEENMEKMKPEKTAQ
jgi:hypothetical protein